MTLDMILPSIIIAVRAGLVVLRYIMFLCVQPMSRPVMAIQVFELSCSPVSPFRADLALEWSCVISQMFCKFILLGKPFLTILTLEGLACELTCYRSRVLIWHIVWWPGVLRLNKRRVGLLRDVNVLCAFFVCLVEIHVWIRGRFRILMSVRHFSNSMCTAWVLMVRARVITRSHGTRIT